MSLELPALVGGAAIRPQGPPAWPGPDPEIFAALEAAYQDGSWGKYHGGNCDRLEAELRAHLGVEHVLLCGSGTFAVELALRALQIGPGDEVLLAGYDYAGNFLNVHAVGGQPVLVDVDPANWNLSLEHLEHAIGRNSKALIVSHLHGGIVHMREVMALAEAHGLAVIEDAAQCPGARVQGRSAGTWGDAGIVSFGGSKLLSAGRGGALLTSSAEVHQRARTLRARGNLLCPLSELQAAVVLPQLRKLDGRNEERLLSVRGLATLLAGVPGLTLLRNQPDEGSRPGYYKVGFQFDAEKFGLSRVMFVKALRAEGIAVDEGFTALHVGRSSKRYRAGSTLGEAERAHHGAVVLHHPVLLEGAHALVEIAQAVRKVHAHRGTLANYGRMP